jgi:hypothetical protein
MNRLPMPLTALRGERVGPGLWIPLKSPFRTHTLSLTLRNESPAKKDLRRVRLRSAGNDGGM